MRTLFPLACGLLISIATYADSLSLSARADAFSEPISIDAFTSGWNDKLRRGDDAALHARLDLRNDHGAWHLAWRWRYDYQLKFSPDTAELYHHQRNQLPIKPGRPYPLNIGAYHIERHGLGFGYRLEQEPLQIEASLNIYQGKRLIEGETRGHVIFSGDQTSSDQLKDLVLRINYRYSEPELHEEELEWSPSPPEGWGYGLDLSALWILPGSTELQLQVDDLFGEMEWRKAPATILKARCDCTLPSYDLNGGLLIRKRHHQQLNPYAEMSVLHPLSTDWRVGARILHDTWLTTHQVGIERRLGTQHQIGLWYEMDYRAWRTTYQLEHVRLSWTADKLDTSRAHRLGLDFTLFWQW